ncbi:MAG TPA: Gfo/Idh/MocA family oxidoreductase [Gaiellaceae bacterium]|nr:Gfo/Idh/MocA family oxidoreductase [Gaiellaceae bacterium]
MTNIGIIGTGDIFDRYVTGLRRFPSLDVTWCADIDLGRARDAAERANVRQAGSPTELLSDQDVSVVVVLTPPSVHAPVVKDVLAVGKHVYVEKPLATSIEDGRALIALAASQRRLLGSAPDTFLGSACQTARAVIDSGEIGDVFGVSVVMTHNGAETRHPDPTFLFSPGGGPLLDLGPYYVTQLVNCLGPISEVTGMTRIGHRQRVVTAPNRRVDTIDVTVPTHTSAVARFASGAIATIMMTFDVWVRSAPFIEIFGTQGQLQLPDPNTFDGGVTIRLNDDNQWRYVAPVIPPLAAHTRKEQLLRGIGVADLAASIDTRRPRTDAAVALHVLEVLSAVQRSSDTSSVVAVESRCDRPEPLTTDEIERWTGAADAQSDS